MSRGILIFGINNDRVDYCQLAIMCLGFIRKNMPNTKVCLATDTYTKNWIEEKNGFPLTNLFDDVAIIDSENKFENVRQYKDTQYYQFDEKFKNESRSSAYHLSPYDETILIDCDYLICNNSLSSLWGNEEDIIMNKEAYNIEADLLNGFEHRLNPFGIPMYWATVIYFRKTNQVKTLFNLVDHIKDNWEFYKLVYDFPGNLFRNDYAFSIAIHIMNGFVEESFVKNLPIPITTILDTDQFFDIESPSILKFFYVNKLEPWKFLAAKTSMINIHCMNKLSLINNMDKIMETLK